MNKTKGQYRRRLGFVFDVCNKRKICKGSDNENTNEVTMKYADLNVEWKQAPNENQEEKMKLSAECVLSIFKAIPDQVCHILGIDPRVNQDQIG